MASVRNFLVCLVIAFNFLQIDARGASGNIKLIAMRNNQYWVSTTSPYAPRLNFFLAYQYCRNLGLQLLTFETQEEMDSLTSYLAQSYSGKLSPSFNAGLRNEVVEYWTSGNTLGTDSSWIWMSSGEQMNSTFLNDHGLGQSHQRKGGLQPNEQCLLMKAINSRRASFLPESCHRSLPFICEQIRCISYYYPTEEYLGIVSPTFSSEFSSGHRSDLNDFTQEASEFSTVVSSSSTTTTTTTQAKPNATASTTPKPKKSS